VVGGDGNVYFWDDHAPDFLAGQLVHGNWTGPVVSGTAKPIRQIANASAYCATTCLNSSELWAIDAKGSIFKAALNAN
jgi:hypothetical protein